MTTSSKNFPPHTELTDKLGEKSYRHAFVGSRIRRGLPLQIRAMREAQGWNQKDLGDAAGIPQANISRIENTRDTFLSFQTLLKIAAAFDVALVVKFAAFSELEELASRPLSDMVPSDFASDTEARNAWEEHARQEAPNGELATLSDYLRRRMDEQRSRSADESVLISKKTFTYGDEPHAITGGLGDVATRRDPQGTSVSLPPVGVVEPLQNVGS